MTLEGSLLIGQQTVHGTGAAIHAVNPATGETLEPAYPGGTQVDVERACELAWSAFDTYRETSLEDRAKFLETVASHRQGTCRTSGHQRVGWPRHSVCSQEVRAAGRRLLTDIRFWSRGGYCLGHRFSHQGGWLHRLTQWRPGFVESRPVAGRTDPVLRRDEFDQSGLPTAGGAQGARRGDGQGLRRIAQYGRGPVLH